MLTRRELISWAISPDMPSYDSSFSGCKWGRRSISIADGQSKRKKKEKGKTSHDKCNKNFQLVRRSRSWFSLSLSLSLSVGNTSRSTTCDKMTKYVENGSGRRARASLLPYQQQLRKFMNQNVFLVGGGGTTL
jgi:hypothetical protein